MKDRSNYSIEHVFPPTSEQPYGSFLLFLNKTQGVIKFVYHKSDKSDDYYRYLLVRGKPILEWQEENGCPTCQQLLRAGNNDFETERADLEIQNVDLAFLARNSGNWIEKYSAVLDLFEPGFYLVTCNKYYPTDGDGNLFWESYDKLKTTKTINFGYFNYIENHPCFLISSQGTAKFSQERFKTAKNHFQNYPGLAFHLDAQISLLLDGHHRALAAAQMGEPFFCVTFSRASWMWKEGKSMEHMPTHISAAFNTELASENLSDLAKEWLLKERKKRTSETRERYTLNCESFNKDLAILKQKLAKKIRNYPTLENLEAAIAIGEISQAKIDEALIRENAFPSLKTILLALIVKDEVKARELALKIIKNENWESCWAVALKYLSRFSDVEIRDRFIDLAASNIKRQDVTELVDHYLDENADLYK